jgi:hypothetical protein
MALLQVNFNSATLYRKVPMQRGLGYRSGLWSLPQMNRLPSRRVCFSMTRTISHA